MITRRLALAALASLALTHSAFAEEKCPEGQLMSRGQCIAACPTEGGFVNVDACECPTGFGKILNGNGGGECRRLACPTGTAFAPTDCECPASYTLKKVKKGKVRCEVAKADPAKVPATEQKPAAKPM